jgi:hypothetical protein
MESINNQNLILTLIKSDLRNQKLIRGLDQAGVLAEDFYTDLATPILKLIGFEDSERNDELYEFYDHTVDRLIDLEVNNFLEKQKMLALELYNELLLEKIRREKKVIL